MSTKRIVCIDGNDACGKSYHVKLLREKYPDLIVMDRDKANGPTKLTDVYDDNLPEKLDPNILYIILDADVEVCLGRIMLRGGPTDKYDTPEQIFKYKNRFIRLAIRYQIPYINNSSQSTEETFKQIESIINGDGDRFKLPNPDLVDVKSLPIIVEGNSKIVRSLNDKFNIIEYKPTVYSHKSRREGVVDGTDKERMMMTKDIIYLLEQHMIPHAYVYIGEKYVLCKKLDQKKDIPNVEVVVKKCCLGSDLHRYYGITEQTTRSGKKLVGERNQYPSIKVRFDYRNPNRDPKNPEKLIGDEAMCDDLADELIDVHNAKDLARRTFNVLDKYFREMNVFFEDVCFMITTNGLMHWSEISQDCGRYKLVDESGMTPLDKDIWRAGGSSDLVLEKWHQMTTLVHNYVTKHF